MCQTSVVYIDKYFNIIDNGKINYYNFIHVKYEILKSLPKAKITEHLKKGKFTYYVNYGMLNILAWDMKRNLKDVKVLGLDVEIDNSLPISKGRLSYSVN